MTVISGGSAQAVSTQAATQQGGPAQPVAVVSGGTQEGGPALPVYVVTSGPVAGGPAMPVYAAAVGATVAGGPAMPVYVVSGSLNPTPPTPPYTLFRDVYSDTDPPPLVTPRIAVPGNGQWSVTDTSTPKGLQTAASRLRLAQAGATVGIPVDLGWGACELIGTDESGNPFARVAGRAFEALIHVEDEGADFAIHWSTTGIVGDPSANGHGWLLDNNGWLVAISNSLRTLISGTGSARNCIRPMCYLCCVVLQASGAYILLSTFATDTGLTGNSSDPVGIPQYPIARLLWAEQSGTVSPLYLSLAFKRIYNYPLGHANEDARVIDITSNSAWNTVNGLATNYDLFTRADSAVSLGTSTSGVAWTADGGTFGISTNRGYQPGNTGFARAWVPGVADGIVESDITIGASKNVGLMVRRQDANNFIRVWLNGGNQISIQTWVAGGFGATIIQTGFTFNVGTTYRIRVGFMGNMYMVWINGANVFSGGWQPDVNNRFLAATGCGLYAANDNGGSFWDNFAIWPHTVTLPSELQVGAVPPVWTPGATLGNDTFTQANGTALDSYIPPAGGVWNERFGDWVVTNNKATVSGASSGAGDWYVTQNIGVPNVECSVDITQPNPLGAFVFVGIIAYVDASNWIAFRLAAATVAQPNDYEIEVTQVVAGVSNVVHKVQFGVAFVAASTHTLKVQLNSDVALIFFDNLPRESYVMPAGLANRAHYGLYRNDDDGGAVFDNWIVKAL